MYLCTYILYLYCTNTHTTQYVCTQLTFHFFDLIWIIYQSICIFKQIIFQLKNCDSQYVKKTTTKWKIITKSYNENLLFSVIHSIYYFGRYMFRHLRIAQNMNLYRRIHLIYWWWWKLLKMYTLGCGWNKWRMPEWVAKGYTQKRKLGSLLSIDFIIYIHTYT